MEIRERVKELLVSQGYEKVMIRPAGTVRLFKNGQWIDGGVLSMYVAEIMELDRKSRVTPEENKIMDGGYGQYD